MADQPRQVNAAQLAARKIKSLPPKRRAGTATPQRMENPAANSSFPPSTQSGFGHNIGAGGLFGGNISAPGSFNFAAPAQISFGSDTMPNFGASSNNNGRPENSDAMAEEAARRNKPFQMGGFGGAAASPAPSAQSGNMFGQNKTGGFGANASVQAPSNPFQMPTSAPPSSTFGFGATSNNQPAANPFAFGQNAQAQTASQPASKGFSFGATSQQESKPSKPFSFGQTQTQQQPQSSAPNLFGNTQTSNQPAKSPFAFGQSQTQASAPKSPAVFNFGATSAPALAAEKPAGNLFSFGQTSTAQQPAFPAPIFSFGATAATPKPAETPAANKFSFGQMSGAPTTSSGNIFPLAPAQAPMTGLFGQSSQALPASTFAGFGSTPAPAQAPKTGLFGEVSKAQPTTTFGASASIPAPAPVTNLFGQSSQAQPASTTGGSAAAPAPSTGLFGQTPLPSATGSNLFGNLNKAATPAANPFASLKTMNGSTNLFGAKKEGSASPPKSPPKNLFGGAAAAPSSSLGLFGQSQQIPQQTAGPTNLFGNKAESVLSAASLFEGQQGEAASKKLNDIFVKQNSPKRPENNLFGVRNNLFVDQSSESESDAHTQKPEGEKGPQKPDLSTQSPTKKPALPMPSLSNIKPMTSTNLFAKPSQTLSSTDNGLVLADDNSKQVWQASAQSPQSTIGNALVPIGDSKINSTTKSTLFFSTSSQMSLKRNQPFPQSITASRTFTKLHFDPLGAYQTMDQSDLKSNMDLLLGNSSMEAGPNDRLPPLPPKETLLMRYRIPEDFAPKEKADFILQYLSCSLNRALQNGQNKLGLGGDYRKLHEAYAPKQVALRKTLEGWHAALDAGRAPHLITPLLAPLTPEEKIEAQTAQEENDAHEREKRPKKRLKSSQASQNMAKTNGTPHAQTSPKVAKAFSASSTSSTDSANDYYNMFQKNKRPAVAGPSGAPVGTTAASASASAVSTSPQKGKRKADYQITKDGPSGDVTETSPKRINTTNTFFTSTAETVTFSKGKRKADYQITKDDLTGDTLEISKKTSATSELFKSIAGQSSSGTTPRSPERKIKPITKTPSGAPPKASAFSSLLLPGATTTTPAPAPTNIFAAAASAKKPEPAGVAVPPKNPFQLKLPAAGPSSGSAIKPPTFGAPSGNNFMAQFAKKGEESEEKKMKQLMEEDLDSDDDEETRQKWIVDYKKKREADKKKAAELVEKQKATAPVFKLAGVDKPEEKKSAAAVAPKPFFPSFANTSTARAASPAKSIFESATVSKPASTSNFFQQPANVFASSLNKPSGGTGSVLDTPPSGTDSTNIFGHLSANNSGGEDDKDSDNEPEADDEGEEEMEKVKEKTKEVAMTKSPFAGFGASSSFGKPDVEKKPTDGPSPPSNILNTSGSSTPTSVGSGSLFDRISRSSNGNPVRQIPVEDKENSAPPSSGPVDHTYQAGTPIKFGGSGSSSFAAAATPKSNPFAALNAKPSAAPAASGLFAHLNKGTSAAPSGTGLFGSLSGASSPFGAASPFSAAPSPSAMFGTHSVTAPSPPPGSGLFGSTVQPASSGSSVFGNLSSAPSPQPLFGSHKVDAPSSSSNLFGNLGSQSTTPTGESKPTPFAGFGFGNPTSAPATFAPSNTLQVPGASKSMFGPGSGVNSMTNTPSPFGSQDVSTEVSRATTPGAGEGAAGEDDKEDKENKEPEVDHGNLPQVDLANARAGEEDEDNIYEVRSKALKFDTTTNKWETAGLGPLRFLKHKETGKTRILLRADPSGKIVLNKGLLPKVKYEPKAKTVTAVFANGEGGLETWLFQVKTIEFAQTLAETFRKATPQE